MATLAKHPDYRVIPTVTTRPRRAVGDDKTAVSQEHFDQLISAGESYVTTPSYGHRYAFHRATLDAALGTRHPFYLLDLSLDNSSDIEKFIGLRIVFLILPSSRDELIRRLEAEGRSYRIADSVREYETILNRIHDDLSTGQITHVVINDDLAVTVNIMNELIRAHGS